MNAIVRVLLVEDRLDEASLIQKILAICTRDQFEVTHRDRLSTTLEALREERFDVVLLDLTLPDSSGLDTVQRIRQAAPRVAVVVLTGLDDEDLAIEATSHGVQDYLVKGDIDSTLLSRSLRYSIHRMRIELIVAEQRHRQRLVMELIPDCRIYFKDLHGRFLEVNPALARLYHLRDPQEAIGKTDRDFFSPEYARNTAEDEAIIIQTGEPIIGKIEREKLPSGQVSWALTTKMPLRAESGEIVGTFGLSRDITALKLTEEKLVETNNKLSRTLDELVLSHAELKETQMQLIQAEKLQSLGQMAASVAHELKNPLAILRVGTDFLADTCKDPENGVREVLDELRHAVDRGESVIRDLLHYSSAGDLVLQENALNAVVEQTLRFVRHDLNKSRVRTVLELGPGLPACRLDTSRFEQVLVNLLTNACHAMPEGGQLRIRSSCRACEEGDLAPGLGAARSGSAGEWRVGQPLVALEIQDSGPGIPEEKMAQVFEPFVTTKEAGKGTGLGLSVVLKILDLHGGKISLQNAAEGGLKVTILLPAAAGSGYQI